ncbi:MAG: hypothetical protein AB7L13_12420 [Acidimicrobiia bacterium]
MQDRDPAFAAELLLNPPYSLGSLVAERPKVAALLSELIGFWVMWHVSGGFDRLEQAGWHRATIYRKVARFKDFFGVHPDDYEFGWLHVDAEQVWRDMALGPQDD